VVLSDDRGLFGAAAKSRIRNLVHFVIPAANSASRRYGSMAGNVRGNFPARIAALGKARVHRRGQREAASDTVRCERQLDRGLRAASFCGAKAALKRVPLNFKKSRSLGRRRDLGMTTNLGCREKRDALLGMTASFVVSFSNSSETNHAGTAAAAAAAESCFR